jgi:hypothetical protein
VHISFEDFSIFNISNAKNPIELAKFATQMIQQAWADISRSYRTDISLSEPFPKLPDSPSRQVYQGTPSLCVHPQVPITNEVDVEPKPSQSKGQRVQVQRNCPQNKYQKTPTSSFDTSYTKLHFTNHSQEQTHDSPSKKNPRIYTRQPQTIFNYILDRVKQT